jgi:hypothetical protein
MTILSVHFVYLGRCVLDNPQWTHLARFLHPGTRQQSGDALVIGSSLNLNFHPYLYIRAVDWVHTGSRVVLLRHDLVASILEVATHTSQFGFVDLRDARERLADQEAP